MKLEMPHVLGAALVAAVAFGVLRQPGRSAGSGASPEPGAAIPHPPAAAGGQQLPPGHPPTPPPGESPRGAPPSPSSPALVGTVLERIDVARYTYLRLATSDGEERWAAVSSADVAEGDSVRVDQPVEMKDFRSDALGRSFERISFGVLATGAGTPVAATGEHGGPSPAGHGGVPSEVLARKVARATGPDALTVAEVFAGKADLGGKQARVRGIVTKATPGILGQTFFHLQDGSGSPEQNTHDLAVMTTGAVSKDAEVVVLGTIAVDAEIGGGLRYPLVLRDAQILRAP